MQKNRIKSNRQKVWEYMRRNRVFTVEDLLLLTGMNEGSLARFLRQLGHAGYLKQVKWNHRFTRRSYRLIRNTGVIAPGWVRKQKRLFDVNLIKAQPRKAEIKLPVTVNVPLGRRPIEEDAYARGRVVRILERETGGLNRETIAERTGLSQARSDRALAQMLPGLEYTREDGLYHLHQNHNEEYR